MMNALQSYTPVQVGGMLGVSKQWVNDKIRAGVLRAYIVGNEYRISHEALAEYQERSTRELRDAIKNKRGVYGRSPYREHKASQQRAAA